MRRTTVVLTLYLAGVLSPSHAQREGLPSDGEYYNAIQMGRQHLEAEDYEQAFDWIRMSAEYGDKTSQHILAVMYLNGQGTEVDYGRAYAWATVAAESRNRRSLKLKDYIADFFNDQQLAVAERMAEQLVDAHGMEARDIVCRRIRPPNTDTAIHTVSCFREHHMESQYQRPGNGLGDLGG